MGARRIFFRGMANGELRPKGPRCGGVLGFLGRGLRAPSPPAKGYGVAQIIFVQYLTSRWPLAAAIFAPDLCIW